MAVIYDWYALAWGVGTRSDNIRLAWSSSIPAGHTLVRTLVYAHCRRYADSVNPQFPERQPVPTTFAYFQSKQITTYAQLPGDTWQGQYDYAYWAAFAFNPGFGIVTPQTFQGAYEANIYDETHAQRKTTAFGAMATVHYTAYAPGADPSAGVYDITGGGALRQLWRHDTLNDSKIRGPVTTLVRVTASLRGDVVLDKEYEQTQQLTELSRFRGASWDDPPPLGELPPDM